MKKTDQIFLQKCQNDRFLVIFCTVPGLLTMLIILYLGSALMMPSVHITASCSIRQGGLRCVIYKCTYYRKLKSFKFHASINDYVFSYSTVRRGVPQGLFSGPILFAIEILQLGYRNDTKTFLRALVSLHLDYGNILFPCLHHRTTHCLWVIQNQTARCLSKTKRHSYIIPNQLPSTVCFRIDFKISFKALYSLSLRSVSEHFVPNIP